jgi:predicted phage gp36 major capsid-like protein
MWSSSDLRDEVLESKVELKAAVESMKSDLMKEAAGILKAQTEEHSKDLAQVQVNKTETRSAGSHRAAGVYSGQGTNASVTALTAEPLEEGQEGAFEI